MSTFLNGSRRAPKGSRVPAVLLAPAIRYEAARAVIFEDWGDYIRANECLGLKRHYERRAMEECTDAS